MLIKLFESEIDLELKDCFSYYLTKAYNIWHTCSLYYKHSQNLTYLEFVHKLDLRLKKFYKHLPICPKPHDMCVFYCSFIIGFTVNMCQIHETLILHLYDETLRAAGHRVVGDKSYVTQWCSGEDKL